MLKSPDRYVVLHNYHSFDENRTEQAWASYNTDLDGQSKTSALSMATQTASRYRGDIFADYGDGNLNPVRSFRRDQ